MRAASNLAKNATAVVAFLSVGPHGDTNHATQSSLKGLSAIRRSASHKGCINPCARLLNCYTLIVTPDNIAHEPGLPTEFAIRAVIARGFQSVPFYHLLPWGNIVFCAVDLPSQTYLHCTRHINLSQRYQSLEKVESQGGAVTIGICILLQHNNLLSHRECARQESAEVG